MAIKKVSGVADDIKQQLQQLNIETVNNTNNEKNMLG